MTADVGGKVLDRDTLIREAFEAGWNASYHASGKWAGKAPALKEFIDKYPKYGPVKIIFLDIDGVLNNHLDSDHHEITKEGTRRERYFYSTRCVNLLNELISITDAKLVISSTWRLGLNTEQMQEVIDDIGVKGEVIGITKDLRYLKGNDGTRCNDVFRGNEIMQWLKENEELIGENHHAYRRYVILDDDSDMLLWQKDNYVNCDPEVGMTSRVVYRAAAILNNSPCEDAGMEYI